MLFFSNNFEHDFFSKVNVQLKATPKWIQTQCKLTKFMDSWVFRVVWLCQIFVTIVQLYSRTIRFSPPIYSPFVISNLDSFVCKCYFCTKIFFWSPQCLRFCIFEYCLKFMSWSHSFRAKFNFPAFYHQQQKSPHKWVIFLLHYPNLL